MIETWKLTTSTNVDVLIRLNPSNMQHLVSFMETLRRLVHERTIGAPYVEINSFYYEEDMQ